MTSVTEQYLRRHSALPLFSTVDMNDLKPVDRQKHFTAVREPAIEEGCSYLFRDPDCGEVYFFENLKTTYVFDEYKISINLNFEKIIEKEFQPSILKVILDIASLESIFFASNASSLLLALFSYFKRPLRLEWREIYRFPILFICFVGFCLHNLSTFNGIINEPLIEDGAFEKLNDLKLPNSIFCFKFNENLIDANHKLTRSYLDERTRQLSYDQIFDLVW